MNSEIRLVIRHPHGIPIEVQPLGARAQHCLPLRNRALAELVFECSRRFDVGEIIMVGIPDIIEDAQICGKVVRLAKAAAGYVIAITFYSENEAFRMRMFEQICHIEAYRKEKQRCGGRKLSREEAAAEWISGYAAGFPEALSIAA